MKSLMQRQLGFSLVEIMIGMTLGLFLTVSIIQLYIGSNRNYRFQEEFSRIQENGRFALELLNNSIYMTNFTGCSIRGEGKTVTNVLNNNTEWWVNVNKNPDNETPNWNGMLSGFDGNTDFPGMVFGDSPANRIRDTDMIISLGGTGSYSVTAANEYNFALANIQKINGDNIQKGDILWICNDTKTVLFQVTNDINDTDKTIMHDTSGDPGNMRDDFPIIFTLNADDVETTIDKIEYKTEVTEYVPTAFYIGVSASGTSRSLFQMQLVTGAGVARMEAEEMVEGVENMQIFYGVDTNANRIADEYADASDVSSWDSVVSVRIELLLASIENNVLSEPQIYFFPNDIGDRAITGRVVIAPDKRRYQAFSTTIGIRNRLN